MSLLRQIEQVDAWHAAADELCRRATEYGALAEASIDDFAAYRWAKRSLRAVKAALRLSERVEKTLAAMSGEPTPC